ncbi:M23 family metallopeptidase [Metabacillus fastidiosus]|uniref:M23 family metallopeptidase n=1 Tax=Metabacillus fastidiosus TaxID=1458 RepID=A0ABU6P1R9_9BACI|nr:M23 family metallopeptidase [Metabacillus fastidiosus]MED4403309.1 M23 family metallopeptidase [Metabacillus fastidiosus]MED4460664.1 M23 family metallopeptidase [Metabacillus fastidiosus]
MFIRFKQLVDMERKCSHLNDKLLKNTLCSCTVVAALVLGLSSASAEKTLTTVYSSDLSNDYIKNSDNIVNSTVMIINNERAAAFKDKKDAEAVLQKYKADYISEKLEHQMSTENTLHTLEQEESPRIDISFAEDILYSNEKVLEKDILTVDEGLQLLKNGIKKEEKYEVTYRTNIKEIAEKYHLTVDELLAANPNLKTDSIIGQGEIINIITHQPLLNIIITDGTLEKEVTASPKDIIAEMSLFNDNKEVKETNHNGEAEQNSLTIKETSLEKKRETANEEILKEAIPSRGGRVLSWPAADGYISNKMGQSSGKLHKGVDIVKTSNYTVKAAENGTVLFAGNDGGYGNKVVIDHNNGLKTVYGHLNSIAVSAGETVITGQKIGVMGSTGQAADVHLHFEVYENDIIKNPLNYLK